MSAKEGARVFVCPFCALRVELVGGSFAYERTQALIHFDGCSKRPATPPDRDGLWRLAGEAVTNASRL